MDELVDLGDISAISFQSPLPTQPTFKFGQLSFQADSPLFDAPFMTNLTPKKDKDRDDNDEKEDEPKDLISSLGADPSATPTMPPQLDNTDMDKKPDNQTTETPSTRRRRVRVNIEVERIIVSIKRNFSNID